MRAIVYDRYGPPEVLRLKEIEKPAPKANEVLIRTHVATVTSGDWRVRSLAVPAGFGLIMRLVFGISKPRQPILGTELAGVVESVGRDVRAFTPGDRVFAFSDAGMGCYAAYKCMPDDGAVAHMPSNLSFEEAAAISFGGTTALHFLRKARLQGGEKVLINGASGGVGTAAVQLARHFGAVVTGVCSSANVELVRSLGADRIIDYTKEDFSQNGETYDVIVDTVGNAPFSRCKASLKQGGRLLLVLAGLPEMLLAPWTSMMSGRQVIAGTAAGTAEELRFLADLAENGHFRPVIDRRYPVEQIVEAHRYVDTGRKKGNVVVRFAADGQALAGA
ncbi:MAG: Zn-dependent oxidoreductase [Cyanobium sp. CACIAM 14]|nr:MAG: Zn-dependent oxidoreductase [Cyanobium sp. CACIAM 14]